MSPEERQLLTDLFSRTKTAAATPRDRDAEALIEQAVREQPAATYYLAQAVIVQEKALSAAAERLHELEARIAELETAAPAQPAAAGGFLGSLFGSSTPSRQPENVTEGPWSRNRTPARPSAYAMPQQQPVQPAAYGGPWGGQQQAAASAGGGFLRGALGTAAGVAGGMLLANSISGLFGGHSALSGIGGASLASSAQSGPDVVEETVVNNYYGNDAGTTANDDDNGYQQADYDDQGADFGNDDSFA